MPVLLGWEEERGLHCSSECFRTVLTQHSCCLCSGIPSGMLQEGLTCITCRGQVTKVFSLFQAANEAEMKQLRSRWV